MEVLSRRSVVLQCLTWVCVLMGARHSLAQPGFIPPSPPPPPSMSGFQSAQSYSSMQRSFDQQQSRSYQTQSQIESMRLQRMTAGGNSGANAFGAGGGANGAGVGVNGRGAALGQVAPWGLGVAQAGRRMSLEELQFAYYDLMSVDYSSLTTREKSQYRAAYRRLSSMMRSAR